MEKRTVKSREELLWWQAHLELQEKRGDLTTTIGYFYNISKRQHLLDTVDGEFRGIRWVKKKETANLDEKNCAIWEYIYTGGIDQAIQDHLDPKGIYLDRKHKLSVQQMSGSEISELDAVGWLSGLVEFDTLEDIFMKSQSKGDTTYKEGYDSFGEFIREHPTECLINAAKLDWVGAGLAEPYAIFNLENFGKLEDRGL
jgi:hypothetical protein